MKKKKFRAQGTLFYHEDDFCQVEIVPMENWPNLLKEAKNISDFTAEKKYTDIYIREENQIGLLSRKINKSELENLLTELETEKHLEVVTGYGSEYRVKSENTIGYGKDYSAVYFNYEEGIITNIWITGFYGMNAENVSEVLFKIGVKWDLVLMDWNNLQLIDLSKMEMVQRYVYNY